MKKVELVKVQMKYLDDIWNFRQEVLECDAENEDQLAGCLSLDESKSVEEWIAICDLRKSEDTCGEAGTAISSHTYLAVRKSDDRVVGIIDLRHHINQPILRTWGGHCDIRCVLRSVGKGMQREMLRFNIQNTKAM